MMKISRLKFIFLLLIPQFVSAQIAYQHITNKNFSLGSYGRVGVDWSFVNAGSIGRRLNLNNMGSIGGRLEEQDYLELAPAFHFKPFKEDDPTQINVQMRFSLYSRSLSLFGNSSTSSLGGLTLAIPEIFAEARNINNSGVNVWVGSRLYRGPDVHIIDHFYFNDHSGQGFGIELKKSRFSTIFVSSTDTTSTLPPYFYLNIRTGTSSLALRQRVVFNLQKDINFSEKHMLTLLGDYHRMGPSEFDTIPDIEPYEQDTGNIILNYPSDFGYVFGIRLSSVIGEKDSKQYNNFSVRYGARLANGGDGGISRTSQTFGAPDLEKRNFNGAFSVAIVDELFINLSQKNSLNAYVIYTHSKGAAKTDGKALTYLGQEVYNRKKDFSVGFRNTHRFTDKFHFMGELHFSQRKDGLDETYNTTKFSLSPVLVPTGENTSWARPYLRFVFSLAHYNKAAKDNLYSPYLQFTGPKDWGYYFGVKAEWWIWD
jgi:maltoporin